MEFRRMRCCSKVWSLGDVEVAQEQGLPLECKRMCCCSNERSLGDIEVAQERGMPLGLASMLSSS